MRSSPPAPRRASRCASTCRCSTCSLATTRSRALYLYPTKALAQDQARKLSALGPAAAAPRDLRRRHAARGAAADPAALEPDPHQPRHAPRRRSCPTTRAGATSSPTSAGWWSTRRTSTAACSARTSPTCCAGCAGSRAAYGAEPRFVLASATIANPVELAERLAGRAVPAGRLRRRSARATADRDVEPAAHRRGR